MRLYHGQIIDFFGNAKDNKKRKNFDRGNLDRNRFLLSIKKMLEAKRRKKIEFAVIERRSLLQLFKGFVDATKYKEKGRRRMNEEQIMRKMSSGNEKCYVCFSKQPWCLAK